MQTNSILLQNISPDELSELITKSLKNQLADFKKELNRSNPDEIFTRREAADFLKINLSTLFLWTQKGKITAFGIANRRYYKKENLLECLTKLNR